MAPQHVPAARQSELVIVANTLPVRREEVDGELRWAQSPGGLVSALSPIVREAGGCWVGWTGGADDAPKPFRHEDILNVAVPVSEAEVAGSYQGMCNSTLWPLYHDAVRPPEYHRHWWNPYVAVNRRFAEEAARRAVPGGRVWIQDYHLQLVPQMLRELRPDVSSGFFLHIPFPPVELFLRLPWRRRVLEGLLGADVIGFQTPAGAYNFTRLADRLIDAEPHGETIRYQGRNIRVGAFPISIDTERYTTAALSPEIRERAEQLQQLRRGRRIILSVDRLDYTKGIDLRLKAFLEWLGRKDRSIRDAVMVQVAVPSRERISEYQILRRDVEELVGQINGEYGELGVVPVQYLRRNLPFEELIAFYLVADVMLVTPLCDGMNLVAKEYVATRLKDDGVLVLSEFAGAAAELPDALLVNPHDVNAMAAVIEQAITLDPAEGTRRMKAMREVVRRHSVHEWAAQFIEALPVRTA